MRVLIVDDEFLARTYLARLCGLQGDVEVIGEADSGVRAIELIRSQHPDAVLLDVELGDMSCFDVLKSADPRDRPDVIIVTAHPEHATRAFDIEAADYLTKPVDPERFAAAIGRVRDRHLTWSDRKCASNDFVQADRAPRPGSFVAQSLTLRLIGEKSRRLYFVEACAVDFVESDANYVIYHVGVHRYLARNSIKRLGTLLTPLGFWRIARSLLVNMNRVEFAERLGNGKLAFTLRGGQRLVSSLSFRSSILRDLREGQLLVLRNTG